MKETMCKTNMDPYVFMNFNKYKFYVTKNYDESSIILYEIVCHLRLKQSRCPVIGFKYIGKIIKNQSV